jgi:TatD DNase family protein
MIDTHAHLSTRFCDASSELIKKLRNENIKVVLAASNIKESEENIILTQENPDLFLAAIGVHPQDTDPESNLSIDEQINLLDNMVKNSINLISAIGECGMDFSPAPPEEKDRSKEDQEKLFRGQICVAEKYNLPLIIHARKAVDETIEILRDYQNTRGVFHCYAGGKKRIQKVLDLGENWYFGIDGNVTYESGLADVVSQIPKDKLILETDSPFLTPEPFRGQKNNPTNVKFVYKKVSEIWKIDFRETESIIDKNAFRLFKKLTLNNQK